MLRNGSPNGGWAPSLQVAPDGSVRAYAGPDLTGWRYDGSACLRQSGGLPSTVGSSLLPGTVGRLVDPSLVVWTVGTKPRDADIEILRKWGLEWRLGADASGDA